MTTLIYFPYQHNHVLHTYTRIRTQPSTNSTKMCFNSNESSFSKLFQKRMSKYKNIEKKIEKKECDEKLLKRVNATNNFRLQTQRTTIMLRKYRANEMQRETVWWWILYWNSFIKCNFEFQVPTISVNSLCKICIRRVALGYCCACSIMRISHWLPHRLEWLDVTYVHVCYNVQYMRLRWEQSQPTNMFISFRIE